MKNVKTSKLRSFRNPDSSIRIQLICEDDTLTEQYHAPDCNINTILARYKTGDTITHLNGKNPTYGNDEKQDLKTALDNVNNIQKFYADLSPEDRAIFNEDPQQFIDYIKDPSKIPTINSEDDYEESDTSVSESSQERTEVTSEASESTSSDSES